jgi:hypothetical protein
MRLIRECDCLERTPNSQQSKWFFVYHPATAKCFRGATLPLPTKNIIHALLAALRNKTRITSEYDVDDRLREARREKASQIESQTGEVGFATWQAGSLGPMFGSHLSIAGGMENDLLAAERLALETVQVFQKSIRLAEIAK